MKTKLNKVEFTNNITVELINNIAENEDYKQNTNYGVDYFSVPTDYILSVDFQDKVEAFGAHYFLFYTYLKTLMLNSNRYYVESKQINRIIKNYCVMYCAEIENTKNIFEDLKATKTIISLGGTVLGDIVTDPYIIYNYRLTMEKRAYNRKKKREERDKEENIPTAPLVPVTDNSFDELFGSEDNCVVEKEITFDDFSEEVF